jgi:hypothetical protein
VLLVIVNVECGDESGADSQGICERTPQSGEEVFVVFMCINTRLRFSSIYVYNGFYLFYLKPLGLKGASAGSDALYIR